MMIRGYIPGFHEGAERLLSFFSRLSMERISVRKKRQTVDTQRKEKEKE